MSPLPGLPQLSNRDRRTLVIGAITVLGLLLLFRGVPAWRLWVSNSRARAEMLTTQLAVARQTVRDVHSVARRSDSLARASLGLAPALLEGETPAQVAASLASYLSETAATAGVQLGGVQLVVDSAVKGAELYRVRVLADGSGDVRGITTLFQLLEDASTPLVAIRSFSISQSEPGAPPNHAETLRTSFEIESLAHRLVEP